MGSSLGAGIAPEDAAHPVTTQHVAKVFVEAAVDEWVEGAVRVGNEVRVIL